MKLNMRDMSEFKALCQGKACLRSSLSSYQIVDLVVVLLEKWYFVLPQLFDLSQTLYNSSY